MSSVSLSSEELRRLVRRDLAVAGAGSVAAVVAVLVLGAGALGLISSLTADRLVVGLGAIAAAASLYAWLAGPAALRRGRYLVFVPVCLIAGPAVLALYDLGAGLAVVVVSAAVGMGAAIAL